MQQNLDLVCSLSTEWYVPISDLHLGLTMLNSP